MIFQPKLSRVGFINKLNGYAGEVVLIPEKASFQSLKNSKFLFVNINGIAVPFAIENIFEKGGRIVVKFDGVNDSLYAMRLLNGEVLTTAKQPSREAKEMSWVQLAGYELIDAEQGSLGKIRSIEEYPQQILATCMMGDKEVLIPLHEDLIDNIDIDKEQIFITLPQGLIDIYLT